jgi:hypothetical protein
VLYYQPIAEVLGLRVSAATLQDRVLATHTDPGGR